jgi:DNA-binding MarR family transcriptional regulator
MAASSTDLGQQALVGFSSPQEEALLNLMRTADCLHRSLQHRLKPSGLTATQYNVLRILRGARPNGLTCSAIGRRMITPEPDITRLLGRLKAQKLLTQQRDKQDRRVVWTRISAQGLEMLAGLDEVVEQTPKELLKALTRDELQEWIRLMKKVSACEGNKETDGVPVPSERPVIETPTSSESSAKPPLPRSSPLRHPLE